MAEELEDKYSRFQRNTGIDLQAEIAAGGDGDLDNYYTKPQTNALLDDKADQVGLEALDIRVTDLEENPGGGVTDHGALTGLSDDDHGQYHNDTRGDIRYYTKSQVDTALTGKANTSVVTDLTAHTTNTSNPHSVTKAQVGLSNVDNTSDLSKPVSTATQTSLDGKASTAHNHAATDINSGTLNIARIPTGTSGTTVSLGNHSHTKSDIGLANVDNTSDASKPISTATQTALDGKQALDSDLTSIAALAPTNDDVIQRKSGAWTNRTMAQVKTDLALTKTDVGLANVDNTTDANKPVSTATQTALNTKLDTTAFDLRSRAGTQGPPRAVKPSVLPGVDASHAAFPGICKLSNGNLLMVWRQGTDHFTTRDGSIKASISTDLGRTWATATTPVAYASDGVDYRDPSVSLSTDGTRVYLTYFKGTASLAAAGCFLRISTNNGSTWGSEIRIDSTLSYSAMCSPLLELANGNLLAFMYGRSGVETFDSVWYSRSTNNGSSWSAPTRLANGAADTQHYQEPWPVRNGNNTVVYFRWGASNIGKIHSTDATATTWQTAASQFNGTGRPAAVWTSYGTTIITYRATSGGATLMRSTTSTTGTSFKPPTLMQTNLYGGMMTYSSPFEVNPGEIICPWAEETGPGTVSRLLVTYINEGGGDTPIGSIPNNTVALSTSYDNLVYATNFYQNDGVLSYPWQSGGGSVTVTDGILNSTAADNNPDSIILNTGSQNQKVEGEFLWTGQSGYGIYLRWVDVNNHILLTPETLGANFRIYTRIAGTLTQVAIQNDVNQTFDNVWVKIWAVVKGRRLTLGVGDSMLIEYAMDTTQNSTLNGSFAGIKLNSQVAATTLCRKLVFTSF